MDKHYQFVWKRVPELFNVSHSQDTVGLLSLFILYFFLLRKRKEPQHDSRCARINWCNMLGQSCLDDQVSMFELEPIKLSINHGQRLIQGSKLILNGQSCLPQAIVSSIWSSASIGEQCGHAFVNSICKQYRYSPSAVETYFQNKIVHWLHS